MRVRFLSCPNCVWTLLVLLFSASGAIGQAPIPLPPEPTAAGIIQPPSFAAEQPSGETLEHAFEMALAVDDRVKAGEWTVSSAESSWAAARAQYMPSLKLGADYYALGDQPEVRFNLAPLPIVAQEPILNQDSAGFRCTVTQPLYTSGRLSAGVNAASASVHASQADLCRTTLDVKMNVAESFVAVLRAARLVEVAQAKVASLGSHRRDVEGFFARGTVSKNDFLAAEVALADAQQQALDAGNRLDIARATYNRALGRSLTDPVQLAELEDDGVRTTCEELTAMAMEQRPELAALAAQAHALQQQAASERAKTGPQVQIQGGYLYQDERYIEPNGVAGVLLGVQWNAIDMGRAEYGQCPEREGRGGAAHAPRRRIADRLGSPTTLAGVGNRPAAGAICASGDCPGRRELARRPRPLSTAGRHEHRSPRTPRPFACKRIRIFSTVHIRRCSPDCGCGARSARCNFRKAAAASDCMVGGESAQHRHAAAYLVMANLSPALVKVSPCLCF